MDVKHCNKVFPSHCGARVTCFQRNSNECNVYLDTISYADVSISHKFNSFISDRIFPQRKIRSITPTKRKFSIHDNFKLYEVARDTLNEHNREDTINCGGT